MKQFSQKLINWQKQYGRHDLPWQISEPYNVWLSEVMLQQTQVVTVLDYYPRFIHRFPNVHALAKAKQDEVLQLWAGLGYYSRARNLHKAAQQVVQDFGGQFPHQRNELEKLCGVGRSTAAAISAFAFQQREAILDGNVKRVLCRVFALDGDVNNKQFVEQLWALAQSLLPDNHSDMPSYTQGLMDLGAIICKRSKPDCSNCPMKSDCLALATNRIAELPRKKSAIEVKKISLYWLILRRSDGAIWLHKRPQKGIWAGLYCVPCLNDIQEVDGLADECQQLPVLKHRLTHRLLLITPLLVKNFRQPESFNFHKGRWVLPEQLCDLGLPKPLMQCLQQIML